MTDGTTAIQVSPVPTESEMSMIRSMFDRAANAIVQASELGQRVQTLSQHVADLEDRIKRALQSNEWLAEQLSNTRAERDAAIHTLADTTDDLVEAKETIEGLKAGQEVMAERGIEARETITRLSRECDDNMGRAFTAERELAAVKAKLEEAVSWIEEVTTMLAPKVAKSEPQFEQANITTFTEAPKSYEYGEPVAEASEIEAPSMVEEATPATAPAEPEEVGPYSSPRLISGYGY